MIECKSDPAQLYCRVTFCFMRRVFDLGIAGLAGRSRVVRIWQVAGALTKLFLRVRRGLLSERDR